MMPPIALYNHAKKLETFNDLFPRKCPKNPSFDTHSLFIPRLRFFKNMAPHSNDAPYCHLLSCKKLETFNDLFPRKCPKNQIFNT